MNQSKKQQQYWQGLSGSLANERLFQVVKCIDIKDLKPQQRAKNNFAFIGFACDLGVKRNHGRIGAKQGPMALRQALANLAVHDFQDKHIFDVGDVVCGGDLAIAQQELADYVTVVLQNNMVPIVLGGGHELAWGHYLGIGKTFPNLKLGIINIDAHFDMRPILADGQGSSGTSFLQIAKHSQENNLPFHYLCLGIQPQANTVSLFETAEKYKVEYITAQTLMTQQAITMKRIAKFIEKVDKLYLTICLDAFSQSIAPGVSAPQALGLLPYHVLPLLHQIIQSKKIISIDIAELSPPYDKDNMTARLGVSLILESLSSM